jgi:hypothetical protein
MIISGSLAASIRQGFLFVGYVDYSIIAPHPRACFFDIDYKREGAKDRRKKSILQHLSQERNMIIGTCRNLHNASIIIILHKQRKSVKAGISDHEYLHDNDRDYRLECPVMQHIHGIGQKKKTASILIG